MAVWDIEDVNGRISEVVELALREGPQTITKDGRETVVVIAAEDLRLLASSKDAFKNLLKSLPLDRED